MKVLIADKLSDSAMNALKDLGCSITFNADLSADSLPDAISDHQVLVVRSTKVTAATIAAAQSLSLIIRAGAGVNTIDLDAASSRGIYVANCPGQNTQAVAELVIGLMIAADRRIVNATEELRAGRWNKKEYSKSSGLAGRTLGIIGLGSIGRAVAKAAQGLNMTVLAWSRSFTPEMAAELEIEYASTPLDVVEESDVISVHVAATSETIHLCDADFFARMKNGAIFINTSRGNVVDTSAMKAAMREKNIKVALDVFEDEPGAGVADFNDVDFAHLITATPHIGASTDQAAEAIADAVVESIAAFMKTGKPLNVVNVRHEACDCSTLVVSHFNKVGVLAAILSEIRQVGINIEEMTNTIFSNGAAASATIRIDKQPPTEVIEKIRQINNIIQVMVK